MTEKIKQAKADTLVRVNNVIYAKVSDAENSRWRSAFGEVYANAFINMVKQAKTVEFLTKEPLKAVKKTEKVEKKEPASDKLVENSTKRRKFVAEKYNVREEESNKHTD